jgi:hypothetical protein
LSWPRRSWRLGALGSLWASLVAVNCSRAEVNLHDLLDARGGGAAEATAGGVDGRGEGGRAGGAAGELPASGVGGAEGGGRPSAADDGGAAGDGSTGGDRARGGAMGEGGAAGAPEPPCEDAYDPEQAVCALLGPTPAAECIDGDRDGWDGCYSGGCNVCSQVLEKYPFYFAWNRCCGVNDSCGSNEPMKCNWHCPPPTERDKRKPCFTVDVD